MKKNRSSRSGFFRPRILLSFAFCSIGVLLALLAFAVLPRPTLAQVEPSSGRFKLEISAGEVVVPSEFVGDVRDLPQVITPEERKLFHAPLELESMMPRQKKPLPWAQPEDPSRRRVLWLRCQPLRSHLMP